jgi:AcrR family transcriptional regulator
MPFPAKTNQETILAAATEIVEREGFESLSMREIARRLELAPNALYHHFTDRNELEAEIAAEGFRQLFAVIKKAAYRGVGRGNGEAFGPETIIRTSLAFLKFARRRPALYQLMLRKHTPTPGLVSAQAELQEFSRKLYSWVESPEVIPEATFAIFGLIHGIATLERAGMLEGDLKRDPTVAISALLTGLSQLAAEKKDAAGS